MTALSLWIKMVDPTHLVNAQHGQFRIGRFELVEGRQGMEMQVNFGQRSAPDSYYWPESAA